jgi:O-antigen/teichoic acid export membrane protein
MSEVMGAPAAAEAAPDAPRDPQRDARRLARLGLLAAMVSRLFGRLVGIGLVVVLAREAAPDTVAVYGYLLGTATLVNVLTDLGVASVAGRDVAAGRLPADGALAAALGPQLASVLAAGAITVLLTTVWGPAAVPPAALALTVAFVIVGGLVNLWAEMLRAVGRVVLEGALQLGSAVALVAAGVAVIYTGGSATDLLVVVVAKEAVVLAIAVVLQRPRRRAEVRSRTLLQQGVWLAVAGTAIVLLWRQGTLVIGGMGSIGVLATYVVATRFLDAGVTVAHTAGFGLLPGLSALAADPAAFRRTALHYLRLTALAGVVTAAVGVLAAGPMTTLPFGEQWDVAVPAVRWVAVAALPVLLTHVAATMLLARGQVRWLSGAAVAGSVTGIASSVLLMTVHPEAADGVIGTLIGATVMVALMLAGLRDLIRPGAPEVPATPVADRVGSGEPVR